MTEADDGEWNDPVPGATRSRHRRYRLVGGGIGLLVGVALFSPTLTAVVPRLWPPGGPRWFTLVLVVAFSLMLPLMVGAWLGETVARRRE